MPLRRDIGIAAVLFLAALIVRTPYITYPDVAVFDEAAYAAFASNEVQGIRYFDIHPPLARMIFGYAAGETAPDYREYRSGSAFGGFPYARLRLLTALAGSLLPVLLFLLARRFGMSRKVAVVVGGIAVVDSLLISYSRLMLPDSFLWMFGLLAVLAGSIAGKRPSSAAAVLWLSAAAVFAGLAVSVKWTGLGFALAALISFFFFSGRVRAAVLPAAVFAVIVLFTHVIVWGAYVARFAPGPVDGTRSFYSSVPGESVFPAARSAAGVISFIVSHAVSATAVQNNPQLMSSVPAIGAPECWPFSCGGIIAWTSPDQERRVVLGGNFASFVFSAAAVLVLLGMVSVKILRGGDLIGSGREALLTAVFAVQFVPAVFLALLRPMFIYHYVPAYFFALLCLGVAIERVSAADRRSGRLVLQAVIFLTALFFVFQSPFTYGF